VRLLGGVVQQQRFFHCVDPAITRKRSIAGLAITSDAALKVVSVADVGIELPMYDITTGTGDFIANGVVSHNCFARPTHTYLDLNVGEDFDRQIVVKTNVVEVLRRELARPSWTHETVALGTNTDPYQRAEGRYRLMPGIIGALADSGTPFSILTKGTLLRRDLGLLTEAAQRVGVGVAVTVDLVDERLQHSLEPGAPATRGRLELVRAVREAGLRCGVMVAPVLPWLTDSDEHLDRLLAELAEAGATSAALVILHLRPGTKEWFMQWLAREHPALVKRYDGLYGGGAYVPGSYRRAFEARVRPLLVKYGFDRPARTRVPQREPRRTGVPVFEQPSLF
jgi:DNA repair photolyase